MPDPSKSEQLNTKVVESAADHPESGMSKHSAERPQTGGPSRSRYLSRIITAIILLLAAAIFILITTHWNSWVGRRSTQRTDDAYLNADITPLSTKISGNVSQVAVEDYQRVKAGDLLVQIKDDDYRAQVEQAEAAVLAAKAALDDLQRQKELQKAKIAAAEADVNATKADVIRTQKERTRQESLDKTGATIAPKLEAAQADEERFHALLLAHRADLQAQRRQMPVLDAQEKQLLADLKGKEAALELARINLGYTRIVAPADGLVSERKVYPGQLVSPGTQAISFVGLNVWVIANYKETQLTHVHVGDPAEVTVDTFPGVVLKGHVDTISPASGSSFALLPPDNATGNFTKITQRIPVKIVFDSNNPLAGRLRPGMSVIAKIKTGSRRDGESKTIEKP
jgi:membrane fusion protein (multidrug efflux system)